MNMGKPAWVMDWLISHCTLRLGTILLVILSVR